MLINKSNHNTMLKYFLSSVMLIVVISGTSQSTKNFTDEYVESKKYHVDTIFKNVDINGTKFTVKFLWNRSSVEKEGLYNEDEESGNLPLTIAFKNQKSGQYDFVKDFSYEEANASSSLSKWSKRKLTDSGLVYLELNRSSGTIHSQRGMLYIVNYLNKEIKLTKVFDYDYTSLILFSKNNDVLLLDGVFQNNFSGEEYKYSITKYTINGNSYTEKKIGTTKLKYPGWNAYKTKKIVLKEMKLKEPALLKDILLADY